METTAAGAVTAAPRRATRLRADALRNRKRIVAAAREMFVEYGAEVPLDEIARRAGVGNATLYRHFPDRAALWRQVVVQITERITGQVEAVLAEEADAFAALRRFVHAAADERIGALCPILIKGFDRDHPDLVAARDDLERLVGSLMERARRTGKLRPDVALGDLMVAATQLTRPLPGIACPEFDRFVHRHLQLFLDGLQAPARSALPGAPATLEDLRGQ